MRTTVPQSRYRRLRAVAAAVALLLAAIPAAAQNKALDEQTFREFEQIVADFTTAERIQAWEAFLQKYPSSSYVPKVKQIIAELRGERPSARATSAPGSGGDPDLEFLDDEPRPAPTARPASTPRPLTATTPRPAPTATPSAGNAWMDGGTARTPRSATASADRFVWSEATPGATPSSTTESFTDRRPGGIASRPPRSAAGVGKATHTEVAFLVGLSPDETYVRNLLFGMTASQRFGRTWGISVEAMGAQPQETALLGRLRDLGAEPEVIAKHNFIAGASGEANILSAIDRVTGQIPYRNDLYVRAGGGIVNTDLEICKETAGQPCAAPLFIEGVNFGYLAAGAGHRFYVTRWLTFRSEVRGRVVFELIDGEMTPRSNVVINAGPTFVF